VLSFSIIFPFVFVEFLEQEIRMNQYYKIKINIINRISFNLVTLVTIQGLLIMKAFYCWQVSVYVERAFIKHTGIQARSIVFFLPSAHRPNAGYPNHFQHI